MYVLCALYSSTELHYLKHHPDWKKRWRKAIRESWVGRPTPYVYYPASSANLIHLAYHVAQFEEKCKAQVNHMDYVFEFGGGYGSMCRLFHNLGFHGRYVIYDLPSFSALQVYFLKTIGLPVQSISEFQNSRTGIVCICDFQQLKSLLTDRHEAGDTMFVGTWSISETPRSTRDLILPLASEFKSFLLAYQDSYGEMNNVDFFDNWKGTIRNVAWHNWKIGHIPGNNYLVGRATSELRQFSKNEFGLSRRYS
jgi:hypothetical protein